MYLLALLRNLRCTIFAARDYRPPLFGSICTMPRCNILLQAFHSEYSPHFLSCFPTLSREKKTSNGRLVPTPQRTPGPNRRTPRQPLLPAPLPIRLLLVALLRLPQTPPALAWPFPLSSMRRNHGLHLGLPPVPAHHIPHRVSRSSFPNTPKFILARQGRRDPPQSNALAEPTLSGPTQALAHIFP